MHTPDIQQSNRIKAFTCVSLLSKSAGPTELMDFLDKNDQVQVKKIMQEFNKFEGDERRYELATELKKLSETQADVSSLWIDPSWYAELLINENPQVIRLIISHLPMDQQKKIIQSFPKNLAEKISHFKAEKRPKRVALQLLRKYFESKLPPLPIASKQVDAETLTFEHVMLLPCDRLLEFFKEIGLVEMAVAFHAVSRSAIRAILHRMNTHDACKLQQLIKDMAEPSQKSSNEAQLNIVSMDFNHISPDNFFLEVGMQFFSKALLPEQKLLAQSIQYKLPQEMGYLLRRYVDQRINLNDSNKSIKLQGFITDKLKSFI